MLWLYCHTSVTSDDMVTVIVTSHKVTEKNIEGSEKIMLYNVYKIHIKLSWSMLLLL